MNKKQIDNCETKQCANQQSNTKDKNVTFANEQLKQTKTIPQPTIWFFLSFDWSFKLNVIVWCCLEPMKSLKKQNEKQKEKKEKNQNRTCKRCLWLQPPSCSTRFACLCIASGATSHTSTNDNGMCGDAKTKTNAHRTRREKQLCTDKIKTEIDLKNKTQQESKKSFHTHRDCENKTTCLLFVSSQPA